MRDKSNRAVSYVRSMIKYCQDVMDILESFEKSYETYMHNKGHQYALSFCVEQIGEMARKLRDEGFVEKYPNVPWNDMAGLRNRIAHGYDTVDLDMVYDIAVEEVPQLLADCRRILLQETHDVHEKMALAADLQEKNSANGIPKEKERE